MGSEILVWLVSNPWRSVCFALLLVCAGLYATISFQSLRVTSEISKREAIEAQILVVDAVSQSNIAKFTAVSAELELLKAKQLQAKADFDNLLQNWPVDCDEAGRSALAILKGQK